MRPRQPMTRRVSHRRTSTPSHLHTIAPPHHRTSTPSRLHNIAPPHAAPPPRRPTSRRPPPTHGPGGCLRDGRVIDHVHAVAARDGRHQHARDGVLAVRVLPMRVSDADVRGDVGGAVEENRGEPIDELVHARRPLQVLIVLVARADVLVVLVETEEARVRVRLRRAARRAVSALRRAEGGRLPWAGTGGRAPCPCWSCTTSS